MNCGSSTPFHSFENTRALRIHTAAACRGEGIRSRSGSGRPRPAYAPSCMALKVPTTPRRRMRAFGPHHRSPSGLARRVRRGNDFLGAVALLVLLARAAPAGVVAADLLAL